MKTVRFLCGLVFVVSCFGALSGQSNHSLSDDNTARLKLHDLSKQEIATETQIRDVVNIDMPNNEALKPNACLAESFTTTTLLEDFLVNEASELSQKSHPSVAIDASGDYWVVWQDDRAKSFDIYAHRFTADGIGYGGAIQINDDTGFADQRWARLACNGSATYMVVWEDKRVGNVNIYGQLFTDNGEMIGENFRVNDDSGQNWQFKPAITADGYGNFIVVWTDNRDGTDDIYAQRYSSNGNPLGSNFRINEDTGDRYESEPTVSANLNGNFVVAWQDRRNGNPDIYAQRYDSNGNKLSANFLVNDEGETASQTTPSVGLNDNGEFVVAWTDERDGNSNIYAQHFDINGNKIDVNFLVNDIRSNLSDERPEVFFDSNESFVIFWYQTVYYTEHVTSRRFGLDGGSAGRITGSLYCTSPGNFDIDFDESIGFVGAWDESFEGKSDVYAQRLGVNADIISVIHNELNGSQDRPSIAVDPDGNFTIVWADERNQRDNIYGQRYDFSGAEQGKNFYIGAIPSQSSPSISVDKTGNLIVVWAYRDIIVQRFDRNGFKLGESFSANIYENEWDYDRPDVAVHEDGSFVIVWDEYLSDNEYREAESSIASRSFYSNGTSNGGVGSISYTGARGFYCHRPSVTCTANGYFAASWTEATGWGIEIYAKSHGNRSLVSDTHNSDWMDPISNIAADRNGNYVVVWAHCHYQTGNGCLYAQRYDQYGNKIGVNFKVNDFSESCRNDKPAVAFDNNCNFVVVWVDTRNGGTDIYAQLYNSEGVKIGDNYQVNNNLGTAIFRDKEQKQPDVKFVNHNIYYTWSDKRLDMDGERYNIYAKVEALNVSPGSPVLAAPQNNSSVDISRPNLTFTVPQDANGDALHFKVEIARDTEFTSPISGSPFESASSSSGFSPSPPLASGSGVCTFTPTSGLSNGDYYWRVRAWDGFMYGPVSEVRKFTVKVAPLYVTLHVNEHFLHQNFYVDVIVKDAENLREITYYLNYPADKLAADSVSCGAFLGADADLFAQIDNTEGMVSVTQQNKHGGANGTGVVSQVRMCEKMNTSSGASIDLYLSGLLAVNTLGDTLVLLPEDISYVTPEVQNSAPDVPQLFSPEEGYITGSQRPLLRWKVPADADNDALHFKVDISKSAGMDSSLYGSPFESQIDTSGFAPLLPVPAGTGECSFEIPFPLENGDYYWQVSAWDGELYGAASASCRVVIAAQPMYITALVNEHFLYDNFYVDVQIEDAQRLSGVGFQLNFPPDQLTAVAAEPGEFFGTAVPFSSGINNTDGAVRINIDSENSVNGNGIIARIKFREKSTTVCDETINLTLTEISGIEESGSSLDITPQNVSYVTPDIQNTVPECPQLLTPASGSNPETDQPELTWQVPVDAENDSLHFMVEIATDSTFSEMIFSSPFESYVDVAGFTPVPPLVSGNCSFTVPYPLVNKQYYWRVSAWDGKAYSSPSAICNFIVAPTGVDEPLSQLPEKVELTANYPNPFNPSTTIQYGLPTGSYVTIHIFDISGRNVKTLVDGQQDAGMHQVAWQADDDQGHQVSTGIYLCRMIAGSEVRHQKLIFAK